MFDRTYPRRQVVSLIGAAAALVLAGAASAQARWPNKPITIVVPFTPGTGIDVLARTIGPKLQQRLDQAVVVENRPGASGVIGYVHVTNSAPDGHVLLLTANGFVMSPSLAQNVPYDPVKSFVPVAKTAVGALALAVSAQFPARTLPEALKLFKESPGKYAYASPGNGTPQHLAMELFKLNSGADILHVPYKGSAGAITDLIGGQVQAMILPVHSALEHARGGRIRLLAVANEQRVPSVADVPTFAEQGVRNTNVDLWYGLLAPARTPEAVVTLLNRHVNEILAMPDVRDALDKQGMTTTEGSPEVLAKLIAADSARWADVIKRANIKSD